MAIKWNDINFNPSTEISTLGSRWIPSWNLASSLIGCTISASNSTKVWSEKNHTETGDQWPRGRWHVFWRWRGWRLLPVYNTWTWEFRSPSLTCTCVPCRFLYLQWPLSSLLMGYHCEVWFVPFMYANTGLQCCCWWQWCWGAFAISYWNWISWNFWGDDATVPFTKGSLSSKKSSATKKHDMKELEETASSLKKCHHHSIQLEQFEREQKEKECAHATRERIMNEKHITRQRISGEIGSLEKEWHHYECQLMMHDSKRQEIYDNNTTIKQWKDSLKI